MCVPVGGAYNRDERKPGVSIKNTTDFQKVFQSSVVFLRARSFDLFSMEIPGSGNPCFFFFCCVRKLPKKSMDREIFEILKFDSRYETHHGSEDQRYCGSFLNDTKDISFYTHYLHFTTINH